MGCASKGVAQCLMSTLRRLGLDLGRENSRRRRSSLRSSALHLQMNSIARSRVQCAVLMMNGASIRVS